MSQTRKLEGDKPKTMDCTSCHGLLRLTYLGQGGFAWVHINRSRAKACMAMKLHRLAIALRNA